MKKKEVIELIDKYIPTNWAHPLLTGGKRVIGNSPYYSRDIERLLLSIKNEMLNALNHGEASQTD